MKEDIKINLMQKSELMNHFSREECATLCSEVKPHLKQFSKNEIIIYEGDEMNFIGIIRAGMVHAEKFHTEGFVDLLHVYEAGDIFGLDTAATKTRIAPVTFIADKSSSVLLLSIDKIKNCSMKERILENIIFMLADDNIKKVFKIEILSKKGLRERILTYLRMRQHKLGCNTFHIRMTQVQFAQYLCVNRSALTYELNQMRKEGVIDFKRDHYTIY